MSALCLMNFCFADALVRARVDEQDNPWFVAKDVCAALGIANSRDAVAQLDEDEKDVGTTDTPGGQQRINLISESGLYALVFKSRKPEAKAFRKWVTGEVLPALRKTGAYGVEPAPWHNAAAKVRPADRIKLMTLAVRLAALDSAGSEAALAWFGELCDVMGARKNVEGGEHAAELEAFVKACVEPCGGRRVQAVKLLAAYTGWCAGQGITLVNATNFGGMLGKCFERKKIGGKVYYLDICLKTAEPQRQ